MKKKLKFMLLCCVGVLSIMLFMTTYGSLQKHVFAEESKSTAVATPIGVELSTAEENELWVGDIVWWEHWMWQEPTEDTYTYEIEIVDGDSIEIDESWSDGTLKRMGIHCVKMGKSTIQVKFIDEQGLEGTTTYSINVVKGKDVVIREINSSLMLGEHIIVKADNMRYGAVPCLMGMNSEDDNKFYHKDWFGDIGAFSRDGKGFDCGLWKAILPGTVQYEYKNLLTEDVYATGTLTIEKPIIETNAPQVIGVGSKLIFESELTNIVQGTFWQDVYNPEITIIEGNDCVNLTSMERTTFTTKDNLEFVKAGTVKLSVKYVGDATALMGMVNEVCSAEKIITITVADKNVEIIEDIEKEDVTIITRETLLDSYKKNNLISVNVTEDGNLLYSWQFAPKDMNTIVNVDLRVDIGVQDKKVAEIASQFDPYAIKFFHQGKLPDNTKVKMSVPEKFYDVKAYVYHLEEDGTATLTYEGMVKDGYIDIPLEHCSTYFITKEKLKVAEETTTEEITTKNNKEQTTTGDETTQPEPGSDEQTTEEITTENNAEQTTENNETTKSDMGNEETTTKANDRNNIEELTKGSGSKKSDGGAIFTAIVCIVVGVAVVGAMVVIYIKKTKK